MAINLAAIVQTAIRTTRTVGVTTPITIARPPAPNPLTGVVSGAPVTQTLSAVVSEPSMQRKASDAAWGTATLSLYVAAADTTFTPQRGDTVTLGAQTLRIVAIRTDAPAGTPISYTIGVGA